MVIILKLFHFKVCTLPVIMVQCKMRMCDLLQEQILFDDQRKEMTE